MVGLYWKEGKERKTAVKSLEGGILNYGRRLSRGGRTEAMVATDMFVGR